MGQTGMTKFLISTMITFEVEADNKAEAHDEALRFVKPSQYSYEPEQFRIVSLDVEEAEAKCEYCNGEKYVPQFHRVSGRRTQTIGTWTVLG
jgi:hypothetical protein